ncbi:hypothetical protein M569_05166 [Genlisea aurea]|uniref:Disease resistance R13L4/SHOC-2-like LRR domain-containing protein n=1 Tax=Genlisea aurea TaxID=192259 RepID=S8CS09_9LAMI|nr:hypothetical protein M569_05166 [Genlisea aurea]
MQEKEGFAEVKLKMMDDAVEEIMRIHRSLPPRPGLEEVSAARNVIQSKLEGLEKGDSIPDIFSVLREMQRGVIHFHSKKKRREAQILLDTDELHSAMDVLIQRASEFLQPMNSAMESSKKLISSREVETVNFSVPVLGEEEGEERLRLIDLSLVIDASTKTGAEELLLKGKLSDRIDYFPDSIGKLSNLIKLDLSENRIAVLPSAIGGLESLQMLDLHGNRIRELPESIGMLRGLISLNLSCNGITFLPAAIGDLENLQILRGEANEFEELPHAIGKCTSLRVRELHLDYNKIKALHEAVGRLESLEIMTLSYNNIRQLPSTMASLSNLKRVDLSFNELGFIPESFCFATKLVRLDVSNNFADMKALPRCIGNLEMLEELICHNNQIRNLPDSFGLLSNLALLTLDGNPLVDPLGDVARQGAQAVVKYVHELVVKRDDKFRVGFCFFPMGKKA